MAGSDGWCLNLGPMALVGKELGPCRRWGGASGVLRSTCSMMPVRAMSSLLVWWA